MADEREGARGPHDSPADKNAIQQGGRQANAAQPLNAAEDHGGPERYPAVDQSDAVEASGRTKQAASEARSFESAADAPTPRQGAGDDHPAPANAGRLGPEGDPAEGRR